MNTRRIATTLSFALMATTISLSAHAGGARFHHENSAGGITAGATHAGTNADGSFANGHGVVTDGSGDSAAASGGKISTATGSAERAGKTTFAADGSVNHASGFSASGTQGSVNSQGSATKSADGSITQSRNTEATAANGTSYQGTTGYNKNTGVTHTGTCTNAGGEAVSCPH